MKFSYNLKTPEILIEKYTYERDISLKKMYKKREKTH